MRNNDTINAFLALVSSGLWEKGARLSQFVEVDYEGVLSLAEEQMVVGLVAAGIEHVTDIKVPKEIVLQFVGQSLQIEQSNMAMNHFIGVIIDKMRDEGIYALLIKGQGIAQCYERPQWRANGDVDLLLSDTNYPKAKKFLYSLSSGNVPERRFSKELGLIIAPWFVELHGTQRTGLSTRVDKVIDTAQRRVFYDGNVRSWMNGNTQIFLPAADEDVFFVFTHFVKHFYKEGGVSLRQLCDWCRLMWRYKDKIDVKLLEKRLGKSGLLEEWQGFATVAVDYLGMPVEAMPMYSANKTRRKQAESILAFILKSGKWRGFKDTLSVGRIFPLNTFKFLPGILFSATWLKVKERFFGMYE